MASTPNTARRCLAACHRPPRRLARLQGAWAVAPRSLTTSCARRAGGRSKQGSRGFDKDDDGEKPEFKIMSRLFPQGTTTKALMQLDAVAKLQGYKSVDDQIHSSLSKRSTAAEERSFELDLLKIDAGEKPNFQSLWYDEIDPDMFTEEHDQFKEDDITSMAHGKLDEVRDMRHYMRLAVWEMPLLSKFAKPFVPPADDEVLRWRYTTYMGEAHPAEKKVVVQFAPDDLGLTAVQAEKLKKLAGPRYNPDTEIVKMSCESFEHQAQNKRYLSDLFDRLVAEAKDPADTFEDVPLDLRHRRAKPKKPKFPVEWRLTEARRLELEGQWREAALSDARKAQQGLLVDGSREVGKFLVQQEAEATAAAMVAEATAGGDKGKSSAAPVPARRGGKGSWGRR